MIKSRRDSLKKLFGRLQTNNSPVTPMALFQTLGQVSPAGRSIPANLIWSHIQKIDQQRTFGFSTP